MMTENPARIRALLDDTLAGEPPLLDMVPDAVTGAERSRRRGRMTAAGGAAAAVLAVTVGAYGLADRGHGANTGSAAQTPAPTTGKTASPPALSHKSTIGIPGLFDHPGTPQEECAKVNGPVLDSKQKISSPQARDYCIRALTQMRALLPNAVVVLSPAVDFDQPAWSGPLGSAPDGTVLPGFTQAYQNGAHDRAKTVYLAEHYAIHTANGDGEVFYETTPPGVKAKPQPGGDIPLGDGTSGHSAEDEHNDISVTGTTAAGMWYRLDVTGIGPVYGSTGVTTGLNPHSDGVGHGVFPDGYVVAGASGMHMRFPNPYTLSEIRDRINARGLGMLVNTIGADPLSYSTASSGSPVVVTSPH